MTDILLDQGTDERFLRLDSRVVKATASDFILDNPGGRVGPHPFRRALVHDGADSLTVNFANDYAGGVKLNGVSEVIPLGTPRDHQHVQLDTTTRVLVIRGGVQFEQHPSGPLSVQHPGDVEIQTFDLHVGGCEEAQGKGDSPGRGSPVTCATGAVVRPDRVPQAVGGPGRSGHAPWTPASAT